MKILHIINSISTGGAERHLLTLCRHLGSVNVDVTVAYLDRVEAGPSSLQPLFAREGIRVIHLGGSTRLNGRVVANLRRLLIEEQPHVLHTHLPRADLAGAIASWHLRCARVCSIHGVYKDVQWSGKWLLPVFAAVWKRARSVIAISHAVEDWLIRQVGVSPERVRVIHYGVEEDRFSSPALDLRPAWGLGARSVIGTIGRLEPGKGHLTLIRALPTILAREPGAILIIVGPDPWGYGEVLQRAVTDLGLDDAVRFQGFQSDVGSFLHTVDVFAFASRSEGFGQVVIEAMAAGKPVVVTRRAPLTEIVSDSETGYLANPDDPADFARVILQVLADRHEAKRIGERARNHVRAEFSALKMARGTLALYSELEQAMAQPRR